MGYPTMMHSLIAFLTREITMPLWAYILQWLLWLSALWAAELIELLVRVLTWTRRR